MKEMNIININGEVSEGEHFALFVRDGEKTTYPRSVVEDVLMAYKGKNVKITLTIDVESEVKE